MMNNYFCEDCGNKLEEDEQFCTSCGKEKATLESEEKSSPTPQISIPSLLPDNTEPQQITEYQQQHQVLVPESTLPDTSQESIAVQPEDFQKSILKTHEIKNIVIAVLYTVLVMLSIFTVIVVFELPPFFNQEPNGELSNNEQHQANQEILELELTLPEEALNDTLSEPSEDNFVGDQEINLMDEEQYQPESYDLEIQTSTPAEELPPAQAEGVPNEYIGSEPQFITNLVNLNPRRVWFEGDYLFAEMFVTNSTARDLYNLSIRTLRFTNHEGVIAEANFGLMEDVRVGQNDYIIWTFAFSSEQVFIPNADLTGLLRTLVSLDHMR